METTGLDSAAATPTNSSSKWRLEKLQRRNWIGNIMGRKNGWCYREHTFGLLVEVTVWWKEQYYVRPHPKNVFADVVALVKEGRWSEAAAKLCEPSTKEARWL